MPIIWKEAMSTGSEIIDNEHKYLFCLVNSVELALKLEDGAPMVEMFLDQLEEYTRKHFDHEEKIQVRIRYPHYQEHHQEHQQILHKLQELKKRLAACSEGNEHTELDISDFSDCAELEDSIAVEDYDPLASQDDRDETLDRIVRLLRYWVLDHVLTSDMKMKKYLKNISRQPTATGH